MGKFGCMCIEQDANALQMNTVCGCCEWEINKLKQIAHSVLEGVGLNTTRCQDPFGSVVLWQRGLSPGQ